MARGHPDFLTTAGKRGTGEEKVDWQFLVNSGTRRISSVSVTNGLVTFYTVPTGKEFYLFSSMLSYITTAATETIASFRIGQIISLVMVSPATADVQNAVTSSPAAPIKMVAGEVIELSSGGGDLKATGSFVGYEIDA